MDWLGTPAAALGDRRASAAWNARTQPNIAGNNARQAQPQCKLRGAIANRPRGRLKMMQGKDQVKQLLFLSCCEGERAPASRRILAVPLWVSGVFRQDGVYSPKRWMPTILLRQGFYDILPLRPGSAHANDLPANKWVQSSEAALWRHGASEGDRGHQAACD